jgi:hypothetical protein
VTELAQRVSDEETAAEAAEPATGRPDVGARIALAAFGALLVLAVPYVLLGVGDFHWFFRDDWNFIVLREADNLDDLFEPHNTHWSTVPVLAFRALWAAFGITTYVPYQATVLLLHLGAAALLRVIMRRAGVRPWLATASAGLFVLFGAGAQNILWGFQIGFTGALTFGLAQLVLLDHDGPVDRRDVLGIGAGLLSLMSAGVGVVMAVVAGAAALGRRGWRVAILHTAPLAAAYFLWWLAYDPPTSTFGGRVPFDRLLSWVWNAEIGTFLAIGHFEVVAWALAVVLVVGLAVAARDAGRAQLRRLATPLAMLLGSVVFAGLVANGRWIFGVDFARSSRYMHIAAALTLPAIAVAAEALARRWRAGLPVLLAVLLLPIPWNAADFDYGVFGEAYMSHRRAVLTNIVRLPEARQVPRDVEPIPDVFVADGELTIGFLLSAERHGKLDPPEGRISPRLRAELRLRLGLAQRAGDLTALAAECQQVQAPYRMTPERGTRLVLQQDIVVRNVQGEVASRPVRYRAGDGRVLTVELDDLRLRIEPVNGTNLRLCTA